MSGAETRETTADHHSVRECDRLLRASPGYNAFRCSPRDFACTCGREWRHVCDEAEGCFYVVRVDPFAVVA